MGAFVLLAASSIAGCSCASAHEISPDAAMDDVSDRDAALDRDAATLDAPTLDALDASARYFTLEPALVDLQIVSERCGEVEGATAMLRATVHVFSSCDTPGPVDVALDASARTITLTPHVWREHGRTDCASIGVAYTRDVAVVGLSAGTWTIARSGAMLGVASASPTPCPPPGTGTVPRGGQCHADCECASGLSCIAIRGDAVCERLCEDPCEGVGLSADLRLLCARGDACWLDPTLGWTCAATTADACDAVETCPVGTTCPPVSEGLSQCTWSIALTSATRHPCVTESDCDPGLDCVERADGRRACEVRCTNSDMSCPTNAPHACMAGNWVCEQLGA